MQQRLFYLLKVKTNLLCRCINYKLYPLSNGLCSYWMIGWVTKSRNNLIIVFHKNESRQRKRYTVEAKIETTVKFIFQPEMLNKYMNKKIKYKIQTRKRFVFQTRNTHD